MLAMIVTIVFDDGKIDRTGARRVIQDFLDSTRLVNFEDGQTWKLFSKAGEHVGDVCVDEVRE